MSVSEAVESLIHSDRWLASRDWIEYEYSISKPDDSIWKYVIRWGFYFKFIWIFTISKSFVTADLIIAKICQVSRKQRLNRHHRMHYCDSSMLTSHLKCRLSFQRYDSLLVMLIAVFTLNKVLTFALGFWSRRLILRIKWFPCVNQWDKINGNSEFFTVANLRQICAQTIFGARLLYVE